MEESEFEFAPSDDWYEMDLRFDPTTTRLRSGRVRIVRPLRGGGDEYDDEVGPMFKVRYVDTGEEADAFAAELTKVTY